jgi:hypothetical protein
MVAHALDAPQTQASWVKHAGGIGKAVTSEIASPGLPALLVAPRRPSRDACDAYGRQRTANCSLSGGDKAMNAWDPYSLPELEAECANDAGQ